MEQAKEMAKLAVTALEEKKAEDVKVIDIRDVSTIADYFIIANGSNQNQLQAMRDAVDEELYKAGYVHVFSKEDRLFYDLERIWKDGKEISVADL